MKVNNKARRFTTREIAFLSTQELQKLEYCNFDEFTEILPDLNKTRDVLLFSCYTGLDCLDIMTFSADFIKSYDGLELIVTPRKKTGVKPIIPFVPKAKKILEKYEGVLPISTLQKHQREIRLIMEFLGINKHITLRSGRKTAGMIWLNSGISIKVVARMLGHTDTNATAKYLGLS